MQQTSAHRGVAASVSMSTCESSLVDSVGHIYLMSSRCLLYSVTSAIFLSLFHVVPTLQKEEPDGHLQFRLCIISDCRCLNPLSCASGENPFHDGWTRPCLCVQKNIIKNHFIDILSVMYSSNI